jgi:hypothetical protein
MTLYPFGHWVLYYAFLREESALRMMFPGLNLSEVSRVLHSDPFASVEFISGVGFVVIPVPKTSTALYTSEKHPPLETFSRAMATWPESLQTKYRKVYGSVAKQILALDQGKGSRGT